MADLTIDQLPEATSISNDDIMIVAAANSSTAKKIKASLVVGRPSPGSGHVIVDGNESDMPQRPNLQFAGETVSVVDDPTLGRTVVEVAGSELKPATTTTLGGVIVGKNIEVDAEGVISTLGGHTIQNPDGVDLEQQPNLQFTGDFTTVTNPADGQKTVVDVTVPPATTEKPGIVQVGGGLDVNDTGVVSTVRGHEVVDPEGNIMAQEDQIQFTGDFITVTDYAAAKKTTVDVAVPFATAEKPGIVQVGTGLSITSDGVLSSNGVGPQESYFPANASLRFSDTRTSIAVSAVSSNMVAFRFFAGHRNSAGTSAFIEPISGDVDGNGCLRISQRTGGNFNYPIVVYYPFMPDETAPMAGKTVTFSFDIRSDHTMVEGEIHQFKVIGTTAKSFTKLNVASGTGTYAAGQTEIGTETITGTTATFSRRSVTFTVPEGITQICLQWTYTTTLSASLVIGDLMVLAKPRIDIGTTAGAYRTPNYADEYAKIQQTQAEIYAWRQIEWPEGSTNKTVIYRQQLPAPMPMVPVTLLVTDIVTPVGFPSAKTEDVTELTGGLITVTRTLNAAATSGSFFTRYIVSIPFFQ